MPRVQHALLLYLLVSPVSRTMSDYPSKTSKGRTCYQDTSAVDETEQEFPHHLLGASRIHTRELYDTIIILDSSSSIGKRYFSKALRALQHLTRQAHWDTHFAVVTVATRCVIVANFTSGTLAAEKLGKLSRSGGKTNLQGALELSRIMYEDPQYGSRFGSFKRILLLSDGKSNIRPEKTFTNAIDLRLLGVEIFVIAHGGSYLDGIEEMKYIASSSDAHLYRLGDVQGFVKLLPGVTPIGNRLPSTTGLQ